MKLKTHSFRYLYLGVFLSFFFIPSSFAINRSTISSSGTLNASLWNVSLNQTGINSILNVVPDSVNGTDIYSLKVYSNSEVDANYSIVVSNLPAGVKVKLDDGTYEPQQDNVSTVTFSNAGSILYSDNQKEKTHILTFKAIAGASPSANNNVDIDVIIQQALQ